MDLCWLNTIGSIQCQKDLTLNINANQLQPKAVGKCKNWQMQKLVNAKIGQMQKLANGKLPNALKKIIGSMQCRKDKNAFITNFN